MMTPPNPKKRHRNPPYHHRHSSVSSTVAQIDSPDDSINEISQKLRRTSSHPILSSSTSSSSSATVISFNDQSTADVVLRLFLDHSTPFSDTRDSASDVDEESEVQIYLHSDVLRRAKYFSALLSDRWRHNISDSGNSAAKSDYKGLIWLNLGVPPADGAMDIRLTVLELLYTDDFSTVINSVSAALDTLPVALELLFEDCVTNCVRYLEAVPWTEEEEKRVINLTPFLREDESKELLARVSPAKDDISEEMLHGLIMAAIQFPSSLASIKVFVGKVLRDFSPREVTKRVLERAFSTSLKAVKECMEEYSSPDFRVDHNETEAIQKLKLHTALTKGKHLVWLVERMIELRVADSAVKEWSEQTGLTGDLQRAFRDDAWMGIVPGLPPVMIRCTYKFANAIASGSILAAKEVRMKLVKDWLPVLAVCKDKSPMVPQRQVYLDLEEIFLRIISTLPMSDSQELLQQCLCFSTRKIEDCTHLVTAFNTWFRRATRPSRG